MLRHDGKRATAVGSIEVFEVPSGTVSSGGIDSEGATGVRLAAGLVLDREFGTSTDEMARQ